MYLMLPDFIYDSSDPFLGWVIDVQLLVLGAESESTHHDVARILEVNARLGARTVVSPSQFTFSPMVTQPPEGASFTTIFGSSSDPTTLLLAAFLLLAGIWLIPRLAQSYIRNLPPGPRGLPLIGDVIHIADHEWLASPQRRDDYGDTPCLQHLKARS